MKIKMTFLLVLCGTCLFASSDEASWFKLLPQVESSWQLELNPAATERLEIKPKGAIDGKTHRVMVLFPKKSSAYNTAMAQILTTFAEKRLAANFLLYHFAGDREAGLKALAEADDQDYDLIFSMGSKSTAFIYADYQRGKVPVVTVCSKDPVLMGQMPDYTRGSGTNVAYTSLDLPIRGQMAYLERMSPNLTQIAVLYARNNTSAVKTQVEPLIEACGRANIEVIEGVVEDQGNAVEELTQFIPELTDKMLAKDPEGKNSIFWITGCTSVFREIRTINQYTGKIPVLSVVPNVVKAGDDSAVLSIGVSFENNAQIAALYGGRILSGQAVAGELPVGVVSPPDIAINFKKARQIGLKIPFAFFESASFVYDHRGILVREKGQNLQVAP